MTQATKQTAPRALWSTTKMAWRMDKTCVLLLGAVALVGGVRPYIGILLSAWVVDALAAGEPFARIATVALLCVGATFVLSALIGVLDAKKNVRIERAVRRYEMLTAEKTLTMDYELLDSPQVNAIKSRMLDDRNWGAGFYSVYGQWESGMGVFVHLAASIGIAVPLLVAFPAGLWALPALLGVAVGASLLNARFGVGKELRLMNEVGSAQHSYANHFVFTTTADTRRGKDVRLYGAQKLIRERIEGEWPRYLQWMRRFSRAGMAEGACGGVPEGLLQGGAYLCAVLGALSGALSAGAVLRFGAALYSLAQDCVRLANLLSEMTATARRQESTYDYLNVPNALYRGTLAVEKRFDNEFEIAFHNVSFRYPGAQDYALKNLNLTLRVGERMAVVGRNGSGKTTMIKLLCRLYDPTEGVITLNGIDIRKYRYEEYQALFAVVFQDFRLFSFPLGQNVGARVEYDRAAAENALVRAGFGERLSTMPRGLDTPLYSNYDASGVEISGGEAQKIALARALYKAEAGDPPAPFIVLDEPTAALDPIAEADVYARFNGIVAGKTAVYISHRLSSCRFCDDICVFDGGHLVQRGSHEALLKEENGVYAALWQAQAQYYAEERG